MVRGRLVGMIALAKGLVTSWGAVVVMGVPKMIMSLTRDGHVPAMVAYTLGWVLAGLVLGVLVPRSLLPWGKPRGNLKKLINMLDAGTVFGYCNVLNVPRFFCFGLTEEGFICSNIAPVSSSDHEEVFSRRTLHAGDRL